MGNFSSFSDGISGGMQQGAGLANAFIDAPIKRRLMEAQALKAERDANAERADMIDYGVIDPSLSGHMGSMQSALPWIAAKKAGNQGANQMPTGLRLKPGEMWDGPSQSVVAVPGSDLYINQAGKHAKDLDAVETGNISAEATQKKVKDLLAPTNKDAFNRQFGGYNAYLTRTFPGAQDERNKLESLKHDLEMAGLTMIKSGGSVGQMTEKEWPIVRDLIGRLNPVMSENEARTVLNEIDARMTAMKQKASNVYNAEWGNTQFNRGNAGPPQATQLPKKRYQILGVK